LRHVLAAGNDRSGNAITNVSGGELNERSRYRKCGLDRLDGPSTRPCGTDSDATHWRRMDAGCCRVVLRFGLLVLYLDPVCLLVELAFTWRAIALSAFRIIKPESIPRKTSSFVTSLLACTILFFTFSKANNALMVSLGRKFLTCDIRTAFAIVTNESSG